MDEIHYKINGNKKVESWWGEGLKHGGKYWYGELHRHQRRDRWVELHYNHQGLVAELHLHGGNGRWCKVFREGDEDYSHGFGSILLDMDPWDIVIFLYVFWLFFNHFFSIGKAKSAKSYHKRDVHYMMD